LIHLFVILVGADIDIIFVLVRLPDKDDKRRKKMIGNLPYGGIEDFVYAGPLENIRRAGKKAFVIPDFLVKLINMLKNTYFLEQGIIFYNPGVG
jgi:hypothetical protein